MSITPAASSYSQEKIQGLIEDLVNIESYQIDFNTDSGEQILKKIVDLVLKKGYWTDLSGNIHKFKIQSEETRIGIATKIAKLDPDAVCENIQNYEIDFNTKTGKNFLNKIAEISLNNMWKMGFSRNFHKFGVKSEDLRIKVARKVATKKGWELFSHIDKYEIDFNLEKAHTLLHEMTTATMEQGASIRGFGIVISKNIPRLKIESEGIRIKIAQIVATQDIECLCESIKNYGINFNEKKGEKFLKEIIEIAKKTNTAAFSKNIHKFNIEPESRRIKLAKQMASSNGWDVLEHIKNYGINSKKAKGLAALLKIIKLASADKTCRISKYIKNYGIDFFTEEGKRTLIEIAKITAATDDGYETSEYIKNYEIDSKTESGQDALIEIAKIAAFNNGDGISIYIKNYEIDSRTEKGQKALIEIVKIAAKNKPLSVAKYLKNYQIDFHSKQGKEAFSEIVIIIFKHALSLLQIFSLSEFKNLFKDLIIFFEFDETVFFLDIYEKNLNLIFDHFIQFCHKQQAIPNHFVSWVNETYDSIKKDESKRKFIEWAIVLTMFSWLNDKTKLAIQNITLLNSIRKTPSWLRILFTKELLDFYIDYKEEENISLNIFRERCKGTRKRKKINLQPMHTEIPCLIFARYPDITKEACLRAIEIIKSDREFRRENNKNTLLEAILQIKECPISANSKKKIIEKLFALERNECLIACKHIKNLISFNELSYLGSLEKSEYSGKNFIKDLENNLNIFFQEKFQAHVENFGEKYSETFGKWRKIYALITFAGKMNSLIDPKKEEILQLLEKFVTSVLNNDFLTQRYAIHDNPHLACIKNKHPEIFEKWQHNLSLDSLELVTKTDQAASLKHLINTDFKVVESDHPNDFLLMGTEVEGSCQSVYGSSRLNKCLLSYILDGKHKMLLIKDVHGNILARTVIRLLVDNKDQPVLFQERMYVSNNNPLYASNLRKLALKKAHDLGIPLVVNNLHVNDHILPFHSAVFAKEKPFPFEYVDALRKMMPNSYSIDEVFEVFGFLAKDF